MAYIGYFDELVLTVGPQIDAVLSASEALVSSAAFRKVRLARDSERVYYPGDGSGESQ